MSDAPAISVRPVQDSDLDALFDQQNDHDAQWMAAFISGRDPFDRAAFDRHWVRIRAEPSIAIWTILFGEEIAGYTLSFDYNGEREVGYWIGRAYWGRGIATAALAQYLEIETTRPLTARVAADNLGSLKVLERNGFIVRGEETAHAPARNAAIREIILELR